MSWRDFLSLSQQGLNDKKVIPPPRIPPTIGIAFLNNVKQDTRHVEGTVKRLGSGCRSFMSNAESDLDPVGQQFSTYILD